MSSTSRFRLTIPLEATITPQIDRSGKMTFDITSLNVGGIEQEFLTLEYAGGDKLYVPVASLHLISRYTGASPESAPLHKLGSTQWEKAKRKAR